MPEITSDDGRYVLAVQGDRNVVVYDRGRPIWDRFSYEAAQAETSTAVTSPSLPATPAAPTVSVPGVLPPGIAWRVLQVTSADDGDLVPRVYKRVKANLDPTGRVACYMTNAGGRFDGSLLAL